MIVRLWRGRATPEQASHYRVHVTTTVWPALRAIDGFVSGRLLERPREGVVEFLVMTEWVSWEAVRSFAGKDPTMAVVEPEARRVLLDFDTHAEHFEVTAAADTAVP